MSKSKSSSRPVNTASISQQWIWTQDYMVRLLQELKGVGVMEEQLFAGFHIKHGVIKKIQQALEMWTESDSEIGQHQALRELTGAREWLLKLIADHVVNDLLPAVQHDLEALNCADMPESQRALAEIRDYRQAITDARNGKNIVHGFDAYGFAKRYNDLVDFVDEIEEKAPDYRAQKAAERLEQQRREAEAAAKQARKERQKQVAPLMSLLGV
jgi:hypothetical protein